MNYIEYMDQGGLTQNVTYTKLQNKVGRASNLFLKRNNLIKAIRDAILQIKNFNVKNNTVVTNDSESTSGHDVSTVNASDYSNTYSNNNYSIVSRVHRPLGDK